MGHSPHPCGTQLLLRRQVVPRRGKGEGRWSHSRTMVDSGQKAELFLRTKRALIREGVVIEPKAFHRNICGSKTPDIGVAPWL